MSTVLSWFTRFIAPASLASYETTLLPKPARCQAAGPDLDRLRPRGSIVNYCHRSVSTGSMRIARTVGPTVESKPTPARTATVPKYTLGSAG